MIQMCSKVIGLPKKILLKNLNNKLNSIDLTKDIVSHNSFARRRRREQQ